MAVETLPVSSAPRLSALLPFPASRKVYVVGSRPDIRVPFREIQLTPTAGRDGPEEHPPVRVYDTSGPYTDPDAAIDITRGLPPLRRAWVLERGDVEEYDGRPVQPLDDGSRPGGPWAGQDAFPGLRRRPLRALPGRAVTQRAYARQGIITPEMEFVALREHVSPRASHHPR